MDFINKLFVILTITRYVGPSVFNFEVLDKIFIKLRFFSTITSIPMSIIDILSTLFYIWWTTPLSASNRRNRWKTRFWTFRFLMSYRCIRQWSTLRCYTPTIASFYVTLNRCICPIRPTNGPCAWSSDQSCW